MAALAHGAAAVIFGLLVWRGAGVLGAGAEALGVPMLIAGTAGLVGTLLIMWPLLRHQSRPRLQRAARVGMAVAGAVTVVVGVALAPAGWERGFVITVNALTGGLLILFALFAGGRRSRQPS